MYLGKCWKLGCDCFFYKGFKSRGLGKDYSVGEPKGYFYLLFFICFQSIQVRKCFQFF